MSEQPLTTQDLARLWKKFVKEWMASDKVVIVQDQRLLPSFNDFIDWLIENDTNQNPYRYPNNPDLPQELDDNGPES